MSTTTLSIPTNPARTTTASWAWLLAAGVIGVATLAMEHDPGVSKYDGYVRDSELVVATAAGGNAARRLSSLAFAGAGLGLLVAGRANRLRLDLTLALPIAACLGWCILSYSWAADPSMCIRRLTVLGCYLVGALGLARAGSLTDITRLAVWLMGTSLALGIFVELALGTFRPWSSEYRFSGTIHPNAQGAYLVTMALAAWVLAETDRPNRWQWLACFAIAAVFAVLTKSRTSVAGLAAAVGLLVLLRTSTSFKFVAGFATAWTAAVGLLVVLLGGFDPQQALVDAALLGRQEQSESLTGRSDIWEEVFRFIEKRPWTGYGYESFWTQDHIRSIADSIHWTILSAHSGYLEVVLSVGLIGLGLFLAVALLGLCSSVRRAIQPDGAPFGLVAGLLVFTLVCSAMESTMVSPSFSVLVLGATLLHLMTQAQPRRAPAWAGRGGCANDSTPAAATTT